MAGETSNAAVAAGADANGAGCSLDDNELLRRFLELPGARAEEAFAALMRRHGPMVLGVCRHVLGRHQDAEDAFQATFLVLARKAGSIRARNVLGRWLYEVAYRTAVRAKVSALRRQAHERQGAQMTVVATDDPDRGWGDLRPLIHEELGRLPEKYRTPIVLCYLEGKTNEEAAQMLDWPVGTVKGRLSRARALLRSRLDRRGVSVTLALLVLALSKSEASAAVVPEELVLVTSRLAVAIKPPEPLASAPVSPNVVQLMDLAPRPVFGGKGLMLLALVAAALLAVTQGLASMSGSPQDSGAITLQFLSRWLTPGQRAFQISTPAAGCHAPSAPPQ